jgi:hypothetical protein
MCGNLYHKVKKAIDKVTDDKQILSITSLFASHLLELAQNSYGNYAIQHALERWRINGCLNIFEELLNCFNKVAMHRYSSNVVEKFILASDEV